jgi:hypothetical protein
VLGQQLFWIGDVELVEVVCKISRPKKIIRGRAAAGNLKGCLCVCVAWRQVKNRVLVFLILRYSWIIPQQDIHNGHMRGCGGRKEVVDGASRLF